MSSNNLEWTYWLWSNKYLSIHVYAYWRILRQSILFTQSEKWKDTSELVFTRSEM